MANYNSNYYELAPYRANSTAANIPRYAQVTQRGSDVAGFPTVAVTASLAANDTLTLFPALPAGFKLTRFSIVPSTALDTNGTPTLAINIGYTSNATAVVSALTALRTTTAVSLTDTQLLAQTAAAAGDSLIVTVSTGAATGATGTVTVLFEGIYP